MKKFLFSLLVFALLFSTCYKSKSKNGEASGENYAAGIGISGFDNLTELAEDEFVTEVISEKLTEKIYDYNKILNGDLSDFAGFWVNNNNERRELKPDGTFGGGVVALGFTKTERGSYFWNVATEDAGFGVELFPVGIDAGAFTIVPSDTTKARMHSGHEPPHEREQIFYLEIVEFMTLPNGTILDTRIPENVANEIIKRFEAIEKGDIAAFRSTLPEMEDAPDLYRNLAFIYEYFSDFFEVDADGFNDAIVNAQGLDVIMHTAFSRNFPPRNRNTGLFIKKMEFIPDNPYSSGGYYKLVKFVVTNNKAEETVYHLTYAGSENEVSISNHFLTTN